MMRICDGKKMYDVRMWYWDCRENMPQPDFELDFFEAGSLEYDEGLGAYRVPDTGYCIEQMTDWLTYTGDYRDDECEEYEHITGRERHCAAFEVLVP